MSVLLLLPIVLSALVLAAHFLRAGNPALMLVPLSLVALVFVRRPMAARVIREGLWLGAFEWLRTLAVLVAERRVGGQPWGRLAVILVLVAAVTAAAPLTLSTRRLRRRYGFDDPDGPRTCITTGSDAEEA